MRRPNAATSLAALFAVINSTSSIAASASQTVNASYAPSNASQTSRAGEPVPANCVRQSCGKLWCWNMGNNKK